MITDPGAIVAMSQRRLAKSVQTLMGIVTGLIADEQLSDKEIFFLRTWLSENVDVASAWPGSVIWARLDRVLADGVVEEVERAELVDLLTQLTGSDFSTGSAAAEVMQLPLQHDVEITLDGANVCHTGVFLYGTRKKCEALTESAGGLVVPGITKRTHYLVVGTSVSPDWANTSYGRKIEAAVALQSEGFSIAIVPEHNWLKAAGVPT